MSGLEIFLIIIGFVIVIGSYLFSEHLYSKKNASAIGEGISASTITSLTEEKIKGYIEDTLTQHIDNTLEDAEAKLEKLSNEKILVVSDYSDKILEEISKSHKEVMFLYNMLNDKEMDIKSTVKEIDILKKQVSNFLSDEGSKDVSPKQVLENEQQIREVLYNIEEVEISSSQNEKLQTDDNNNNNILILEYYKQGKSIMEIAKELGLGIGEVRLVIDLFEPNNKGKRS